MGAGALIGGILLISLRPFLLASGVSFETAQRLGILVGPVLIILGLFTRQEWLSLSGYGLFMFLMVDRIFENRQRRASMS
jgi:hypothetical protein